jgi:hypothetical protein
MVIEAPIREVIEIETLTEVARDLNRAADLLESGEWGWCQGAARRGDKLCLLGAIAVATGNQLSENQENFDRDLGPRYEAAFLALSLVAPGKAVWNDQPCRIKTEVVAKLREAADHA